MLEHRNCMLWRLKYLSDLNFLTQDYYNQYNEMVLNKSVMLKNLMLKFSLTRNNEIALRIADIWKHTMYNEANILTKCNTRFINKL